MKWNELERHHLKAGIIYLRYMQMNKFAFISTPLLISNNKAALNLDFERIPCFGSEYLVGKVGRWKTKVAWSLTKPPRGR